MYVQQHGPDLELVIREIKREIHDLQTAARIPQISNSALNLQTDRDTTGLAGTAGLAYGGLAGGTHEPSVEIVVPQSRRILCQFGALAGVVTSTAPNNFELASMCIQIPLLHSAGSSSSADLYVVSPSAIVYSNVSNTIVIDILEPAQPGDTITVTTVFSHSNPSGSVSHFFKYPWLVVQPL